MYFIQEKKTLWLIKCSKISFRMENHSECPILNAKNELAHQSLKRHAIIQNLSSPNDKSQFLKYNIASKISMSTQSMTLQKHLNIENPKCLIQEISFKVKKNNQTIILNTISSHRSQRWWNYPPNLQNQEERSLRPKRKQMMISSRKSLNSKKRKRKIWLISKFLNSKKINGKNLLKDKNKKTRNECKFYSIWLKQLVN